MTWQFWRKTWQPIETAPENPERKYLAVDTLGNILLVEDETAGQAEHPRRRSRNRRDACSRVRALVKAHGIAGETIEGVKVVGSAR